MNDGNIPKPLSLDDTKPTELQLHEAYEMALRLWQLQPWDMPMGENQLLAVEYANGRRCVISVLGEYGEHHALTVYPDVASYERIAAIPPDDELRVKDAFFSIYQRQIAFLKASQLPRGGRAAFKASGVKFPRGINPSLESYMPGYEPVMMGGRELAETIEDAKTFLDFMASHSAEDIAIYHGLGSLVSTWRESPDGKWTLGEDEFSPLFPVAVRISPELLEKVAGLPVNEKFNLEIGALPIPCGRNDSGRGIMARLMIAVEASSHFTMGTTIVSPPDGRELDWTPAVDFMLKTMLQFGYRPRHLAVIGGSLKSVASGLCRTTFKGTEFLPHSECDALREVFYLFTQSLGR